ncbi:hypothetical protein L227DRAFT_618164 [Lentinus tigrinus ALCF2SS1-6]|uniref:Uncharacterized protein n=1 Tax=Lentinus tigrinus ALCF2SS1-6 TaxID=1328759 RepID=A0A5C2RLJ0_9APHY|nr:hypothetical protein L227DRAFT_618164 [Lentinus tigrinus ALCF2SS1-6]
MLTLRTNRPPNHYGPVASSPPQPPPLRGDIPANARTRSQRAFNMPRPSTTTLCKSLPGAARTTTLCPRVTRSADPLNSDAAKHQASR